MGLSPTSNVTAAVTAAQIEALFTASGQIFQGTGNGTGGLVLPPGYEFGYDPITANVTVTSSSESAGTAVINCNAHTFDGAAVWAEFSTPRIVLASGASALLTVCLFEGSTQLTRLCTAGAGQSQQEQYPATGRFRFTPTAGSHTYTVTAFYGNVSGSIIFAGAGGTSTDPPGFIRFVKV